MNSLRVWLLGLPVLIILGFASAVTVVAWMTHEQIQRLDLRLEKTAQVKFLVTDLIQHRAQAQQQLILYSLSGHRVHLEDYKRAADVQLAEMAEVLALTQGNASLRSMGEVLSGGFSDGNVLQHELVSAIERGELQRAKKIYDSLASIYKINWARLRDLLAYIDNDFRDSASALARFTMQALYLFMGLIVAATIILMALAYFYRMRILNPIQAIHHGIRVLAAGEANADLPRPAAPVELVEMTEAYNRTAAAISAAQVEITKAKEEALAAARGQAQFLANMSHEIRTPLNAVIGMRDLLAETPLTPEQSQLLASLGRGAELLLGIVNDILDFSRLDSGGVELELSSFDLRDLVKGVGDMVRVMADKKRLPLQMEFHPDQACMVRGDARRIKQVMLNLLGNAVKFTEVGEVAIVMTVEHRGPQVHTHLCVRDSGIGIEEAKIPLIFSRFKQSDAGITSRFGGTGLGLAIVKQLVDLMGGHIAVKSEVGRGSEFCVAMTLASAPAPALPIIARQPASSTISTVCDASGAAKKILVVDDTPDNLVLMAAYLKHLHYQYDTATNGMEAVRLCEQGHYDAVLMDMQMPLMDGHEAVRRIRQREHELKRQPMPIIALTAHTLAPEIKKCLASGCDRHLAKPVKLQALQAALVEVGHQ